MGEVAVQNDNAEMVRRVLDMRSDTVTKPTEAMRAAMANAEVDDDVLGCDPTAFHLETEMARMMGKEAGLFVPSGTMGNLISVLAHCDVRGSEVILGDSSHIHIYENGGISTLGGVHPRLIKNDKDGTMDLDLIEAAIRDPKGSLYFPTTRLICIENSHAKIHPSLIKNDKDGTMDLDLIEAAIRDPKGSLYFPTTRLICIENSHAKVLKVGELARKHGLKLHIDGARIFNAAAALNVPVDRLVQAADSVSVCLSKGLGAPVGTVIVGSKSFITKAKTLRKTLGGGMRQIGVLCAAALVALEDNVKKLEDDHKNAKILAGELNQIPGLKVDTDSVEPNIMFVHVCENSNITAPKLYKTLVEHCILVMLENQFRVVLHHQITANDVQYTLSCIQKAVAGASSEQLEK